MTTHGVHQRPKPRMGVVCGLEQEADWLLAGPQRSPGEVEIAVAGMGPARAREAAHRLLEAGVEALISWGSAAGLDPALLPGTIVLPCRVLPASGPVLEATVRWRLAVAAALPASVAISCEPLAEAPAVLATATDKLDLRRTTGAVAADMESAAVAAVARAAGIPWIAVRAIADPAGDPLPTAVLDNIGEDGSIDPGAVLRSAATSLRQMRSLVHLGRHHARAGRAMRRLVQAAGVPLLAPSESGAVPLAFQESP